MKSALKNCYILTVEPIYRMFLLYHVDQQFLLYYELLYFQGLAHFTFLVHVLAFWQVALINERDDDDDEQRCAKADRDPQSIWDPRKDCGSFIDKKAAGATSLVP